LTCELLGAAAARLLGAAGGVGSAVVALATFDHAEPPPALVAWTRYQYCVPAARPVSFQLTTLAPSVVAAAKVTPSVERCTAKPVSSLALSVQVRLIWLVPAAAAARLLGAAGALAGAVTVRLKLPVAPL